MNSPVISRLLVLVLVLTTLVSCRAPRTEPIVDVTPIGDALRFLAVAMVLGAIITSIFELWGKD